MLILQSNNILKSCIIVVVAEFHAYSSITGIDATVTIGAVLDQRACGTVRVTAVDVEAGAATPHDQYVRLPQGCTTHMYLPTESLSQV
jgi:hypothetical protein